jgi:hypothetical protein
MWLIWWRWQISINQIIKKPGAVFAKPHFNERRAKR